MTISAKRMQELQAIPEEAIDYSDIPELDAEWFKKARLVFPDERKEQVTIRIDPEVLGWFRSHGRGYQTRMNAVLRAFYEAHKTEKLQKTGTK